MGSPEMKAKYKQAHIQLSCFKTWQVNGDRNEIIWMGMKFGNIILAIIGLSTSLLVCVADVKRWQKKKMAEEKLRIIREALEAAEERAARYQERHDRILSQISCYYLTNTELLEALEGARASMNQAIEFAVCLRRIQFNIISSFPDALPGIGLPT